MAETTIQTAGIPSCKFVTSKQGTRLLAQHAEKMTKKPMPKKRKKRRKAMKIGGNHGEKQEEGCRAFWRYSVP
jgi:hypothetical protein